MAQMSSPFPPPVLPPQQLGVASDGIDDAMADARHGSIVVPPEQANPYPVVARPERNVAFRIVVAALGFVSVVLAWQVAAGANGNATEISLRRASLLIAGAYASAHTVFALWTYRYRCIIDDLRWQMPHRTTWRGAWAAGWSLTTVAAASIVAPLAMIDAHATWYAIVGATVVAVRITMLKTLGASLARVVLGARRRLTLWGGVIAATDLLVVGVLVTAFIEIEPRRSMLTWLAAWAVFALVDVGVAILGYMKRVERWTLAWWLYRHEPFQPDVAADIEVSTFSRLAMSMRGKHSDVRPVSPREMLPVLVLRYVVVVSYWLVAAAALRAGLTVGLLRGELTLASDTAAAIDRLERSIQPFIVAVVIMQVAQGLWSVVQARAARHSTDVAPSAMGMGALFMAGPAVLVYGLLAQRDDAMLYAVLALFLNLVCWVASFGAFSATIQDLGRSARTIAMWSGVVSLHWILGFALAPLLSFDDDMWLAVTVMALSVVDAAIVVFASIQAWHAMRGMEHAVRDRAWFDHH